MKKYLLGLFLVTLTIIYSTPIIATAVTGDPNDAFGNVEVAQPVKDQTVSPTDKLSVVWNMANEKMSKLIAKKRYVFFRVTLVQEPTCADLTTCPPQKYELTNGKKYTRATDLSYSYDVATLPAGITGRYRVAVCYQVYAGQRLSKLLARTRCGASATFNFVTLNADGSASDLNLGNQTSDYNSYDQNSFDQYQSQQDSNYYDLIYNSPISGQCGLASGVASVLAPSSGLCSLGSAGSVGQVGSQWQWTCLSSDGGSDIGCLADVTTTAPPIIPPSPPSVTQPVITSFTATPALVTPSTPVRLDWTTTGALSTSISRCTSRPGLGTNSNLTNLRFTTTGICTLTAFGVSSSTPATKDITIVVTATPIAFHILSPNGGEVWGAGTTHNITWNLTSAGTVSIELRKGTSPFLMISSGASDNGLYSWAVPSQTPLANDYRIRVTKNDGTGIYDESAIPFSIASTSPTAQIESRSQLASILSAWQKFWLDLKNLF